MRPIRHLVWDFDGTLFNTYPAIITAFQQAVTELGGTVKAEEVERLVKVSFDHILTVLGKRLGVEPESVGQRFYAIYAAMPPESQPPFPGARELCEAVVQRGGRNGIATHRGRDSLERLLEAYEMRHLFCAILTHDDGLPRKPDPAQFATVVARCNIRADEALGIGDRALDIESARAAGLRTCLFGEKPPSVQADFTITSLWELWPILFGEPAPFHHPIKE